MIDDATGTKNTISGTFQNHRLSPDFQSKPHEQRLNRCDGQPLLTTLASLIVLRVPSGSRAPDRKSSSRNRSFPNFIVSHRLKGCPYFGSPVRLNLDLDGNPETSPVCDSYAEFMYGAYKLATLDHPYYREIGQEPVASGTQTVRATINETVDGSVFDRWRADGTYRPPNLTHWAERHGVDPAMLRSALRADNPATVVP